MKRAVVMIAFCFIAFFQKAYAQQCTEPFKLVILGSSTSVGTGTTHPDSSYVGRLDKYFKESVNVNCQIINLAVGATTTYNIQPRPFVPPSPFSIDTLHNIEAAVNVAPDAILINFPSNDAAEGIPISVQKDNFKRVADYAASYNIPVWVTSTQPRNFADVSRRDSLIRMRDTLLAMFGNKYIDFWTGLAQTNGRIQPVYAQPDGIHLNNAGHDTLFNRIRRSTLIPDVCTIKSPIVITNFTAKTAYQNVFLNWESSKLKPGIFVVEYSKSGTGDWTKIGEVNAFANGQTSGTFTYKHLDAITIAPFLFYRIVAFPLNGNPTYSNTQQIQLPPSQPFLAYGSNGKLIIIKNTSKTLLFSLYDINGRVLEKGTLPSDRNILTIPAKGIYILTIRDESGHRWTRTISI